MTATDVVWITGPPGVGKSTTAWALYERSRHGQEPVLHVDIDQLEIVQPDPDDDPGRHRLGLRNLAAVVAHGRAAGFARVLVSGVIDPEHGIDAMSDDLDLHLVRLRCDPDDLVRRYLGRTGLGEREAEVRAEARTLDRTAPGHACVETTGRSPLQVVDEVAATLPPLPTAAPVATLPAPSRIDGIPVLLVTGPRGIGTSSVGWEIASRAWRNGRTVGYVDLSQLGFSAPVRHDLRAAVFADVLRSLRSTGARSVVAVGEVESLDRYTGVPAELDVVRLVAGQSTLVSRLADKASGGGPNLAGDDLRGLDAIGQRNALVRAMAQQETASVHALGRPVRVDGLTVSETADRVLDR